jgi:hypothetical protein
MYRSLLFSFLLMLPGIPLAAQDALKDPLARATFRSEQILPPAVNPMPSSITSRPVPRSLPSLPPILPPGERTGMNCPEQSRRFMAGAAIGLLVGGAVGAVWAERLPNPGVGDVPPQIVYVPLFALPSGLLGGVIGARSGRCP